MKNNDDGHTDFISVSNIEFTDINITSIYVYTNGFITLNEPLTNEAQLPNLDQDLAPDHFGFNNLIAPFWTDISTINGGDVFYRHVLDTGSLLQISNEINLLHGRDAGR